MTNHNRFVIQNGLPGPMVVNVEPECVQVALSAGEKVTVQDTFENEPVTLKVESDNGDTIISVWPGDGEVRVEKDGVDVFDLAGRAAAVNRGKGNAGRSKPLRK
jgi:hypothetical protein